MNSILTIAWNTFFAQIRARALVFPLFFGLALGFFMHLAPSWDIDNRSRMFIDAGLSLMRLFGFLLVVFGTLPLLPAERERQTLAIMVSMGIERWKIIVGLYVGSLLTTAAALLIMGILMVGALKVMAMPITVLMGRTILLMAWELSIIAAWAMLCSAILEFLPALAVVFFLFALGNMTYTLDLATTDSGTVAGTALKAAVSILPNLFLFNLKDAAIRGEAFPFTYDMLGFLYALILVSTAMILACWAFESQELS